MEQSAAAISEQYQVSCQDRQGHQLGRTFNMPPDSLPSSVIRQGWQEAITLCGGIDSIGKAFVYDIEGNIIGSLR